MLFEFSQEQLQLAEAIGRWIGRDYGAEKRRAIVHSADGVSPAAWATMAELGLLALPVPEEQGGFGGDALAMFAVMQELGRGLVVEPYMATVLGAEFLRLGLGHGQGSELDDAQGAHGALLAQVAEGKLKLACALGERQSRHDAFDIATRGEAVDGGYRLHGDKRAVLHGAQADVLIVSARSAGEQGEHNGVSLFAVAADSPGVSITGYRTLDGLRAADVKFDGVMVGASRLIGRAGEGGAILDAALDHGAALLCAEALGAMAALFDATLDYLKARQQFGAPIGKFQALQHRMADMAIHLEQARSMVWLAALTLVRTRDSAAPGDVQARRRAVSAAKYRVGQAARFVGQGAVQLHGGMGVTDELPASHYFKRLSMIELTLGDMDHHLERFMAQPGFRESA